MRKKTTIHKDVLSYFPKSIHNRYFTSKISSAKVQNFLEKKCKITAIVENFSCKIVGYVEKKLYLCIMKMR